MSGRLHFVMLYLRHVLKQIRCCCFFNGKFCSQHICLYEILSHGQVYFKSLCTFQQDLNMVLEIEKDSFCIPLFVVLSKIMHTCHCFNS